MWIAALLTVGCTPALSPDQPSFAPAKGLVVERTAQSRFDFELDDWSCEMKGQSVPSDYLPRLEVEGNDERVVRTTDTYLASADGKPLSIRRAFPELSAKKTHSVAINDDPKVVTERNGTCALKGCVVLLDDRAAAGERRKLEQGQCDRELVDAIVLDYDLTSFLPSDAQAKSWQVPASALNLFDRDFGGIAFTYSGGDEERHDDPAQLARNATGAWTVQRGEPRDEGGVHVLPLAISGKQTSHSEIESELRHVPVASGPTTERADMTLEARGEILWDLQHHVLHSLSLEGTASMTYQTNTKEEDEAGAPVYSQKMSFRGNAKISVETKLGG